MTPIKTIASPSELSTLNRDICSSAEISSSITTIELQLLAPLSSEEFLNSCIPDKVPKYDQSGNQISEIMLNLNPLTTAWRKACSALPMDTPRTIILSITPPEGIAYRMSKSMPIDRKVMEGEITRFVHGLATVMAVRSKRTAKLELKGGKKYGEERRRARSNDGGRKKGKGCFEQVEDVLKRLSRSD